MNLSPGSVRTWWWLYAAAALSLFTTLTLPYIGEEGVYTISSLEMRLNRDFLVTTLYGSIYGRPPFLNWLIIPLAEMMGWERVLLASRLVAATATLATGLVLAWLTQNLTRNSALAALSALVFLSGDALFYRGWLAYSDPVFTLCIFGAIACLWVSVRRRRGVLLWIAAVLLACGFLTKEQTAYLYYGVAFAALLLHRDARQYLFSVNSVLAHAAALAAVVVWNAVLTHGLQNITAGVIAQKLMTVEIGDYLNQLWSFPLETVLRFMPASLVAIYFCWRQRTSPATDAAGAEFPWRVLLVMVIVNYLPYWLGPKTHIRYIMPLYPLISLLLAAAIWRCGERPVAIAVRWLAVAVALRYVIGLWGFPWYQQNYRGDYAGTAAQITAATHGFPLYATDYSATGLSVTAHLDTMRYPEPYLRWPPTQWNSGFALSYTPDAALGQVKASYRLGGNTLYLLCRGAACGAPGSVVK
jgi:4-amino-4-deoxy-L-arabinose transferase-like glycosyltransferase